ncbi:MAG TPA: hypothetical protein VNV18_09065 [Stellaceae bacterium]|nr:hypothetical protein [Stellaceae bacterium]
MTSRRRKIRLDSGAILPPRRSGDPIVEVYEGGPPLVAAGYRGRKLGRAKIADDDDCRMRRKKGLGASTRRLATPGDHDTLSLQCSIDQLRQPVLRFGNAVLAYWLKTAIYWL